MLLTPKPEYNFEGLKDGDCWCVCAIWFKKAVDAGRASLEVDGKMVDYPIVYRAENLIKTADNIARKETAMRAN